ncbi:MAG: DUF4276 family protein [Bryobacterales bacterium]|nr:DUF4276 family protein [Bryobacterales bacterium]
MIRRIVQAIDPSLTPIVPRGFRHSASSMLNPNSLELNTAINTLAVKYPKHAILVLIDSDDDCPKSLGPQLLSRAKAARPDLHISVVLAHREYEVWFLASAESLAGKRLLPANLAAPADPEAFRDAKGWLNKQMSPSNRYSPTLDQAALSASLDLHLAHQRSRSFRKLWKEIQQITASAPR